MKTTILIQPDGERFKVSVNEPGIADVTWHTLYHKALIKASGAVLRCKREGKAYTVTNEVKDVQSAQTSL